MLTTNLFNSFAVCPSCGDKTIVEHAIVCPCCGEPVSPTDGFEVVGSVGHTADDIRHPQPGYCTALCRINGYLSFWNIPVSAYYAETDRIPFTAIHAVGAEVQYLVQSEYGTISDLRGIVRIG